MKEKRTEPINVLFVCVGNAARSQMAEGFLRQLGGDYFRATSAGMMPHWRVDPQTVEVMREVGVDISSQRPKGLEAVDLMSQDAIVTMGCPDNACPRVPDAERWEWELEDPHDKPLEVYRAVRDEIRWRVAGLVEELGREE